MTPPRPRSLPGSKLLLASATLLAIQLAAPLGAQSGGSAPAPGVPPAISQIRQADLERDLYTLAGDSMRGREAGTLDEMRASMWLAEQMRRIGLVPKGEDGSWFQWWNMRVTRISDSATTVRIGDKQYALWTESQRTSARPRSIPVLLVHRSALGALRTGGQKAEIHVGVESFEYPSVNVIGAVPGSDPALRGEYVVFSSHQDHDGVRYTVAGDSIWNGADDNASTSVALLAIARAWVKEPSKRSALFIFHGAEERGLLGSRYHVAHPVVPLDSIVDVLNGDMIGRNDPDTAALLGSQPPHRNSAELVNMAIEANQATSRFVIDSSWDRPSHPEGWYFRSDHVPYAERGVPALFFSTNLHSDYHTPRDEPKRIDYEKLTRMTCWMYMTGWIAGNAAERPAVDSGFVLR
jgi:hypothetical protein